MQTVLLIGSLFRTSMKNWKQNMTNKRGKRPVVAKRNISTNKDLYCIFVLCDSLEVQIAMPKGKSVIGRYGDFILKRLKDY